MNSFRLMTWLAKGDRGWSDVSSKEQMEYLHSIKCPRTDLERSYAQYRCQNYYRPKRVIICQEIAAAIICPFFFFYCICRRLFSRTKGTHIDAIGEFKGMPEIVPDCLNNEYEIHNEFWGANPSLGWKDYGFAFSLAIRYFFSPYFVLKCLAKVAAYSTLLRLYTPRAIIVHSEYTFTSSILTYYCESRDVKHINVMHGEKLLYIGWSFFRFTICYVWSEHYRQLLVDMGAEPSQFVIAIPPALKIDPDKSFKAEAFADYKYYLQIYTEEELVRIVASLSFIEKEGKTLRYRPHPRFSDISLLEKIVPNNQIEYPREVDILTSVASCRTAIGFCSTVLYQAFLCNKEVILDDVTYKLGYEQLFDHRYVLSNNDSVKCLSQLQRQ